MNLLIYLTQNLKNENNLSKLFFKDVNDNSPYFFK